MAPDMQEYPDNTLFLHRQVNGQNPLVQPRFTCLKIDFFLISQRKIIGCVYWLEVTGEVLKISIHNISKALLMSTVPTTYIFFDK